MTTIENDAKAAADWIAAALSSSGYAADYSPASLWEVERFFRDQAPGGRARRGGLLADDQGKRLFALGSYVGEVLVRNLGGRWSGNDQDPEAEINVAVHLTDGSQVWPVQRVLKRFKLGEQESIAAYGAALGLVLGPAPGSPGSRKPWWRFW